MADDRVQLTVDGHIAVVTNNNPAKHNAFDDDMDLALFDILGEIKADKSIRAVVWRGEGKSWSSGRDVSAIGGGQAEMAHHALMERGHRGIQQIWDIDAPILVAIQGWAMGGSFQRALLCDIRVAAEGARFRLPEVDPRGNSRHWRGGPAVRDLRVGFGERHGAHRTNTERRGGPDPRNRVPHRAS